MKPPLLLVGHGTRDEKGVADFMAFVERLDRRLDDREVAGGFIELSPPPLTDAVGELYGRGHRRVVSVPMMLVAAGHAKGDIPGALIREKERHDGFDYVYGRPLGPHPTMLRLLAERLDDVLGTDSDPAGESAETGAAGETAVLLVGRGSTDPDANAEVCKVARLFQEGHAKQRGVSFVEPAFISLAWPSVCEGLDRIRRLGARRVVVLPYFLFSGILPDRVVDESMAFAADHPDLDIRCAPVIGDCDGLADMIVERYDEALAGDIRMNCDTCVYRIALPGFEDKVGAPQTPHHHPDDPAHGHGHSHGHAHGHGH
ncbi:sirohydrochlorin chelatase [Nocardiopsis gilva YIM 90087]|uniref:Sirohydrochlorin chelatase n=1 Tax=Nocardiopsis gilva YIM 90087 TaxID=1235441 RepID=A0A223S9R5_9ACTN|nr:sirohydrochlorin chelatase [Nocardiopsis gilva]ASU84861.1 sirohydrochlorin chelatase [Nocardiopsis gilva YIM 90087]